MSRSEWHLVTGVVTMTNPMKKGRDYEYEVQEMLRKNGYVTTRSSGSHGEWDITAVKKGLRSRRVLYVLLIQAKMTKRR